MSQISVTKDHEQNAARRNSHHCMVADAIRDALPNAKYITVDLQSIRYSNMKTRVRHISLTPPTVQRALINFDQGRANKPFKFTLKTHMTRSVDWQANHPNSDRRKRKYKKTGKKRVHISKERKFGVRVLEA